MPLYAHASDIHLDHLHSEAEVVAFAKKLVANSPAAVLLTGDISIANGLTYHLMVLEREIQRPIFFVLGNHDFYGSTIDAVREQMKNLTNGTQFLKYLPMSPYTSITKDTALVGHDGWYDAGHGDAQHSRFMMTDWFAIGDFVKYSGGQNMVQSGRLLDKIGLIGRAKVLAHEATTHVQEGIKQAARHHKNIVVMTHFPPFIETHLHRGAPPDAHSAPWYTNKMMGQMLTAAAAAYPNNSFTILSGHTHGKATAQIAPNMVAHVAGAEYGSPALSSMFNLP